MDIWDKKYNCTEYYDLFSSGKGVSLGGIFHLPVVANFYFEPGLSIDYGKFHIKDNAFIGKNGELLQNGGVLKQNSIIYSGLKLPLVLGYHFDFFKDFNLSIFQGPVLDYGMTMNAKVKIEQDGMIHKTDVSLFKPYPTIDDDYLRRFYMQWRIGASLNYKQFMAGIHLDGEVTNMYRVSDYNKQFYKGYFTLMNLYFTIGYNFK